MTSTRVTDAHLLIVGIEGSAAEVANPMPRRPTKVREPGDRVGTLVRKKGMIDFRIELASPCSLRQVLAAVRFDNDLVRSVHNRPEASDAILLIYAIDHPGDEALTADDIRFLSDHGIRLLYFGRVSFSASPLRFQDAA